MGYRILDQVLVWDHLGEGADPTYDLDGGDMWYLGLAGELAAEIKCSKITLPMLSRETFDWKEKLTKALEDAISLRPQKHVDSFDHACSEFSKEMANKGFYDTDAQSLSTWFSNKETLLALVSKVEYVPPNAQYKSNHGYDVSRRGLILDLPPKVIVLAPQPEYLGALGINEKFFNFFFLQKSLFVYYLRELVIDTTHSLASG